MIGNPKSASASTGDAWNKSVEKLTKAGLEVEVAATERAGHAIELAQKAAEKGFRKFIAAGGDGTVHEVLTGLLRYADESKTSLADFTLAALPYGTGNDWIRTPGVPEDVEKAADCIIAGKTAKEDVVRMTFPQGVFAMANIGGIGTPIGTPPNATAVKFLGDAAQTLGDPGLNISFGTWMMHMVPYVVIMIIFAWILLQIFFPFKASEVVLEIPENKKEKDWKYYAVWIVFLGTILLWMTESITKINSNIVALIPLGVLTACGIFTKEDIKQINWSVLWLVAGGFALGTCLQGTGLAKVLINAIPFGSMSVVLVLVVAGLVCYFLSNFISNSATAALLIPILIVVAEGMADPEAANNAQFLSLGGSRAMIVFIAACASIAMLFPISTPPNAIASSTGLVETKDMAKVGILIGVIGFVFGFFWLTKIFPFA